MSIVYTKSNKTSGILKGRVSATHQEESSTETNSSLLRGDVASQEPENQTPMIPEGTDSSNGASGAFLKELTSETEELLSTEQKPVESVSEDLINWAPFIRPLQDISIDLIDYDMHAERVNINSKSLSKLANSIKKHGMFQPVCVRQNGKRYTLVFGSRRLTACSLIGQKTTLALVLPQNSKPEIECAWRIIENTEREDFRPIALATAIRDCVDSLIPSLDLMAKINLFNNYKRNTQKGNIESAVDSILDMTKRSPSTIANCLRLLKLPDNIQQAIEENKLTPSVGSILANHADHSQLFHSICEKAIHEKLPRRAVQKLFPDAGRKGSHEDNSEAQYFLKQLDKLTAEFSEKSAFISAADAERLMQEVNQLLKIVEECQQKNKLSENDNSQLG